MPYNITISWFNMIYCNFYFFQARGIANSLHSIFSFLIQVLLNFLLLKYQNQNTTPFQTHPKSTYCAITSFLVYCILHEIESRIFPRRNIRSYGYVVFLNFMLMVGSLSVASLGSILLPDSAGPFLYLLYAMLPFGGLLHSGYMTIMVNFRPGNQGRRVWPLFFSLSRFMACFHHIRHRLDLPIVQVANQLDD